MAKKPTSVTVKRGRSILPCYELPYTYNFCDNEHTNFPDITRLLETSSYEHTYTVLGEREYQFQDSCQTQQRTTVDPKIQTLVGYTIHPYMPTNSWKCVETGAEVQWYHNYKCQL